MSMRWDATADVVVLGSGVAGLSAALRGRELGLRVLVVTKDGPSEGSTRYAQGGIAAVLADSHDPGDAPERHLADTLAAGAGLCDPVASRVIVGDGPAAVRDLRARGAELDGDGAGNLARTREGGHSAFRVVHAGGDATGAEVQRALLAAVDSAAIPILAGHTAVEALRTARGGVGGLSVLDAEGAPGVIAAPAVVLATGGTGQLYRATTNPPVATGDGLALALRAGASLADLEFVQFHPTALYAGAASGRRALVTEAVRGEGGVLIDADGNRIMAGVHPAGDLAPRDVVAAAISRQCASTGAEHVYLDATHLGAAFADRFPTVYAACSAAGIDPVREPIPVAPAAHFACGGVVTSADGRTEVPGLYAVGEVARTGLHGANRLASNSLLEGLVVGGRAAAAMASDLTHGARSRGSLEEPVLPAARMVERSRLQQTMTAHAGIGRDATGLGVAAGQLRAVSVVRPCWSRAAAEDAALLLVAEATLAAASAREETRGSHVRRDFPLRDDTTWRRSLPVKLDVSGRPMVLADGAGSGIGEAA
jgi:L-aspartate oxidase